MDSLDTYDVHLECKKYSATKTERFVKQDDLILAGYPIKELQKINMFNWYYPNEKQ